MFRKVRRARMTLHFLRERLPHYGPLINDDLHQFRQEIVKAAAGASVAATSGLIFACFFSVAVLVTTWDSHYRVLTAWAICLVWAGLALSGLVYARKAVSGPLPFRSVSAAVSRDYAALWKVVESEETPASH